MIRTSLASFADSRLIYSVIGGLINGLPTGIRTRIWGLGIPRSVRLIYQKSGIPDGIRTRVFSFAADNCLEDRTGYGGQNNCELVATKGFEPIL